VNTEELRRLLSEATPGPWHQSTSGWFVDCADGGIVSDLHGKKQRAIANGALIAAAVNALPRYLDLADAVREWRATWEVIDDATAAVEMRRVAREKMFAALDALD